MVFLQLISKCYYVLIFSLGSSPTFSILIIETTTHTLLICIISFLEKNFHLLLTDNRSILHKKGVAFPLYQLGRNVTIYLSFLAHRINQTT